ncbi:brain acid soluble protein 1-like [Brachypodium distachyon]|uniref:brain acid soluble protein 1-like n=1 Tax=Brachypodium distachyon TaxID=15368 RepID=UPI000D0CDBC2|nr:brain acid soluble protein 1-like [Brachypodium distachyon]|eukprot:XP_024311831.1 brain acid soluble protein 1-like [Brachypodium distachyon]
MAQLHPMSFFTLAIFQHPCEVIKSEFIELGKNKIEQEWRRDWCWASTRAEGSDSDDSSLGVGGDLSDDDAPSAASGVAPREDDEEDDVPLVRRSAAERASRQEASPQPHGDAGVGASGGGDAAAAAAPTTPATPTAPPARSGPPARSILADRVLKLKPAGSSRKRGQTSASPAAPTKKPRPASGGGDQDAADAAVVTTPAAARDPRVPDSSSRGNGPAVVAGAVAAAPAPTEVQVIDLTGEVDDDAPTEVASVEALLQSATAPAGP